MSTLPTADHRYDLQAWNNATPSSLITQQSDIVPLDLGLSQQESGSGILVDWNDINNADWYFLQRQKPAQTNQAMGIFLPLDPSDYQDDDATEAENPVYNVSADGDAVLGNG